MKTGDSNTIVTANASDLASLIGRHGRAIVLTDDNVDRCCRPLFEALVGDKNTVVSITVGEESKSLDTVVYIWSRLMENCADRNTLLVNLGGGVVSDLGGFAASCYNRGIAFVNVPTTLLAMVDASLGGKTGFDFMGVKNKIGLFSNPEMVYVNTGFLDTLPRRQLLSGLAEMVKCGFVADRRLLGVNTLNYKDFIDIAMNIKQAIVTADRYDTGRRMVLNFGHTIGHALESVSIDFGQNMLHGEAVAMGMFCGLYLSHKRHRMPVSLLDDYVATMLSLLGECDVALTDDMLANVRQKLIHDKKTHRARPVFVLLDERMECVLDDGVSEADVTEALGNLQKLLP